MDINVVAVVIFILVSLFVPASMLLTSFFLRRNTEKNQVRDSPYESAEMSSGNKLSVMGEYLHYFGMFIAFELIVIVAFLWAPGARSFSLTSNMEIIGLLVLGFIFEGFVMLIAKSPG